MERRRPHELSGGQRTRLVLARALAVEPKLLILDESLSRLDLSLEAQILNLLIDLQERYELAYLVVAHDLTRLAAIADQVIELREGRVARREAPLC
jgi:ABC-type dipeptide/oligopeptide/nickel transport system ATPase subunit